MLINTNGCSLQLSPSFTPTSVIRKMYESKEKSREEPASGKAALGDSKEDTQKASEGITELLKVYCPRKYDRGDMGVSADQPDLILCKALGKNLGCSGPPFHV